MVNSKQKGKRFEREIANKISESGLDEDSRRSIMSGAAFEPGDLKTSLPFYIECKHRKRMNIYGFWDQIKAEIERGNDKNKRPMVVVKKNRKDTLAILDFDDFLEILQFALEAGYR